MVGACTLWRMGAERVLPANSVFDLLSTVILGVVVYTVPMLLFRPMPIDDLQETVRHSALLTRWIGPVLKMRKSA